MVSIVGPAPSLGPTPPMRGISGARIALDRRAAGCGALRRGLLHLQHAGESCSDGAPSTSSGPAVVSSTTLTWISSRLAQHGERDRREQEQQADVEDGGEGKPAHAAVVVARPGIEARRRRAATAGLQPCADQVPWRRSAAMAICVAPGLLRDRQDLHRLAEEHLAVAFEHHRDVRLARSPGRAGRSRDRRTTSGCC